MFDFSQICTDSTATTLSIFDLSIAPQLLYYSYIPISIFTILIGAFTLFKSQECQSAKIFFIFSLFFSIYIVNELVQWILVPVSLMYFTWSLSLLWQIYIVIYSLKFLWLAIYGNSNISNVIGSLIVLPVIIFLPTSLNLISFDSIHCEAETGLLWDYLYSIVTIYIPALVVWLITLLRNKHLNRKKIYLVSSILFFISVFFVSNFYGDITSYHEVNLIGPLGMFGFLIFIAIINFKYSIFKINYFKAQLLILLLLFLLGSQLFLAESTIVQFIIILTFLISSLIGVKIIKNVRQEIKQREEIEKLARGLEKANNQLRQLDKQKSEFVSIASHQLRSPLTAIRGYASMLNEGSFGEINDKQREIITHIQESGKMMANSIEDYLSISRIESGNMKYEYSDFNLKELTEQLVDELRGEATSAGLLLLFKSDVSSQGIVHADKGKVYQILHNLINNALKYTPKGSINVFVQDNTTTKSIKVSITDTGIGMDHATINKIFEKFSRAHNANEVNIKGTGLGLYVARALARAMNGDISASSEGEGKGSTFTFTIPLVM